MQLPILPRPVLQLAQMRLPYSGLGGDRMPDPSMTNPTVADLAVGKSDSMASKVLVIYARKPPEYAVYGTDQRVLIQFADRAELASDQRKVMSRLNPLRGEINGLIDGWRCRPEGTVLRRKAQRYDRRVGDALLVAFESDLAGAELLLAQIKQDILDERIAWARFEYLIAAFWTGLGLMVFMAVTTSFRRYEDPALDLWRSAAAGSVGAFFSIALAIRGRTVLPDLQRMGNIMDAILRMVIGVIAAAVLMAFIRSGAVTIAIGPASPASSPAEAWLYVLIVGFLAGFSERMVPDLLAKASATTQARQAPMRSTQATSDPDAAHHKQEARTTPLPDVPEEDPLPEEAGTDACVSEVDLGEGEATPDEALPPATGGVAPAAA